MRGFLWGSLALIVAYAVLQSNAASRITAGSNAATKAISHFLSPLYAPIPESKAARTDMGPITPGSSPIPAGPPSGQPRQT